MGGTGRGRILRAELAGIDAELPDPVLNDPFRRPEELRRPGLVAPGLFQGAQDQLAFPGLDDGIEPALLFLLPAFRPHLEGGRQMDRLDRIPRGDQDRPLMPWMKKGWQA